MNIISFNANSIRKRLDHLRLIIDRHDPDVIGIQETKVSDPDFPVDAIADMGYHASFYGQKTHYGVATLTRQAPSSVKKGFPGDDEAAQRRLLVTDLPWKGESIRVINGYFPQGESREHPVKFPGKQRFYADLQKYLEECCSTELPLVVMGDFNISPQDSDIGIGEENRKRWLRTGKCSFLPEEREWYQKLLSWGLTDTWRHHYPDASDGFSWFDYRSGGFEREPRRGLRIDHILVTEPLKQLCKEAGIDYHIRGMELPSDHAPVWARF